MDFCPTVKIWGMCLSCPHPADTPMPDEISARLLKETAEQIAPSLTLLYNKSLETGVFPDEWNSQILCRYTRKITKIMLITIVQYPC
jgi:hypothetical protein